MKGLIKMTSVLVSMGLVGSVFATVVVEPYCKGDDCSHYAVPAKVFKAKASGKLNDVVIRAYGKTANVGVESKVTKLGSGLRVMRAVAPLKGGNSPLRVTKEGMIVVTAAGKNHPVFVQAGTKKLSLVASTDGSGRILTTAGDPVKVFNAAGTGTYDMAFEGATVYARHNE